MIGAGITTVAAVLAANTEYLEGLLNKLGARKLKRAAMGLSPSPSRRFSSPVNPRVSLGHSPAPSPARSSPRRGSMPTTVSPTASAAAAAPASAPPLGPELTKILESQNLTKY